MLHDLASKTNHKLVSSHSGTPLVLGQALGNLDSLNSPWPELGGSHHLPSYSIFCSSPRRLHPNDTFSQDSQSGVPKLSWIALPRLWASMTSCSDLLVALFESFPTPCRKPLADVGFGSIPDF